MIAATILVGRALAPVQQGAAGQWKNLLECAPSALVGFAPAGRAPRGQATATKPGMPLPPTRRGVRSAEAAVDRAARRAATDHDRQGRELPPFAPGDLARASSAPAARRQVDAGCAGIVGVWSTTVGQVRSVWTAPTSSKWEPGRSWARHIGYLPQDIELFGKAPCAQNIARFA
jgi:hypothetical protein